MKINNEKLNVKEAFTQNVYTIPDYQREFVWGEKEVNRLLEDINEEFDKEGGAEYFIGSIVVQKSGVDSQIEVIDGQQRLTTLFLCLCAFKKLLKDNIKYTETIQRWLFSSDVNSKGAISESYRLILTYEDTDRLVMQIAKEELIKGNLKGSAKKIYGAYEYALDYLKTNYADKSENDLISFFGYFTQKVNFIQIETPSISDALKIFETINERGVGLNPMDLLKNLIFRQLEKDEFSDLKIEWKKITKLLEKHREKSLRFLRYFIMANYIVKIEKESGGKKIVREVLTEDEIYEWLVKNNSQCKYQENPFDFVRKMYSDAESYVNFSQGKYKSGDSESENNVYLDNITKLGGSLSQHLMLLLAAKDLNKELFDHLAQQIETLLFYYIVTKTQTKEFETKFSKWSQEIRKLTTLDKEEQEKGLNTIIENRFQKEISEKQEEFRLRLTTLNMNSIQNYRLKYLLAKITQYIEAQRIGEKKQIDFLDIYMKTKVEIEHILPNDPTQELRMEFETKNKDAKYDEYKIKLGNLTLLEKFINASAGRDFFDKKKAKYKVSKFYVTRSIVELERVGNTSIDRINSELKSFAEWNADSINSRQDMLYNLAKKIWSIQ